MMNTEPLIRVTVCVNRKKGTTEEEFNKYWAYEHGPLATEWLLRCGIQRYVQVCLLDSAIPSRSNCPSIIQHQNTRSLQRKCPTLLADLF